MLTEPLHISVVPTLNSVVDPTSFSGGPNGGRISRWPTWIDVVVPTYSRTNAKLCHRWTNVAFMTLGLSLISFPAPHILHHHLYCSSTSYRVPIYCWCQFQYPFLWNRSIRLSLHNSILIWFTLPVLECWNTQHNQIYMGKKYFSQFLHISMEAPFLYTLYLLKDFLTNRYKCVLLTLKHRYPPHIGARHWIILFPHLHYLH